MELLEQGQQFQHTAGVLAQVEAEANRRIPFFRINEEVALRETRRDTSRDFHIMYD